MKQIIFIISIALAILCGCSQKNENDPAGKNGHYHFKKVKEAEGFSPTPGRLSKTDLARQKVMKQTVDESSPIKIFSGNERIDSQRTPKTKN